MGYHLRYDLAWPIESRSLTRLQQRTVLAVQVAQIGFHRDTVHVGDEFSSMAQLTTLMGGAMKTRRPKSPLGFSRDISG
jgi:hypothetical protein